MSLIHHLSFLFTSQHPSTISYICKPPSPVQKLKMLDISFSSRTVFHLEWRTQDPPYQIPLSRTLCWKLVIQSCRDHTASVLAQVDTMVVLVTTSRGSKDTFFVLVQDLMLGLPQWLSSVQFSQSCLCDPMNCSTPGLHVHHQLLELTQTHVH